MLVIKRRIEETIVIDGPAVIKVLALEYGAHGGLHAVKLGITAERSVTVLRGELVR